MAAANSERRLVASELIILAGEMDHVADEISALGGELAIRHATDGRIYWQAADAPEESAAGTRKRLITPEDCRRLLTEQGAMLHNRLRDTLASRFDCGERTAKTAIQDAVKAGTIRKTGGAVPHYEAA